MKCPKCGYLGFETSPRCKNCGYDFSLLTASSSSIPEIEFDAPLRSNESAIENVDAWLHELDQTIPVVIDEAVGTLEADVVPADFGPETDAPQSPPSPDPDAAVVAFSRPATLAPPLPLFVPADAEDDEPLIRMPAPPRPPLAVRRTPVVPRLRAVSRARAVEPALNFHEEGSEALPQSQGPQESAVRSRAVLSEGNHSIGGQRVAAAAIDHGLLLGIDLVVLYFTLRMAGLTLTEWTVLPAVPFVTFLALIKFAYFTSFTAVGGQTIGKMATGIQVVTEDYAPVDGAASVRRTIGGSITMLTLGMAYLPALFGSDQRALHDRLTRTRVIAIPPA